MDFKKYDRVYVAADSTSYGGRFAGAVGTVNYCYPGGNKLGVLLQSHYNPNSEHGWYYFCANELRLTSNDQGLTSRNDAGPCVSTFSIKKVIFNDPAVIVLWNDGTKTVVKCSDDEVFDPEKGLAMAISKKALGNEGNYYNTFKKYLSEYAEQEEAAYNVIVEFQRRFFGSLHKKETT